jgi:hypothetical protein
MTNLLTSQLQRRLLLIAGSTMFGMSAIACGGNVDDSNFFNQSANTGGATSQAGSGGSTQTLGGSGGASQGGHAGTAGTGMSVGGSAGVGGTSGLGGNAGSGGNSGGTGGASGTAGISGTGGASGTAGIGGTGGISGTGGASGTAGIGGTGGATTWGEETFCYPASETNEDCLPKDAGNLSEILYNYLINSGNNQNGACWIAEPTEGPVLVTDSGDEVNLCCYKSQVLLCGGRPLLTEAGLHVSLLTRRNDWSLN